MPLIAPGERLRSLSTVVHPRLFGRKHQTAEDVLSFARRYGPLWACTEHRWPCLWPGHGWPDDFGIRHAWVPAEPLDWWLQAARRLRAVLSASLLYWRDQRLDDETWRDLGFLPPPAPVTNRVHEGLFISSAVNAELQRYGVGLHLNHTLALEVNTGLGFLPALWQQVAVAGGVAIAVCVHCARPYIPKRAPKRGQRSYCPECQSKRKTDSYRDRRNQRKEQASGES